MSAVIKLLLVDDHAVVRAGYRHLLQADPALHIVAEAGDAAVAYEAFTRFVPDVVVMDISLPGVSGIEAMRRMLAHRSGAKVLIFSMHTDRVFVTRALDAGAAGFLSKSSAAESLVEAVHMVVKGGRYLSPDVASSIDRASREEHLGRLDELSTRELEVFRLMAQGYAAEDIGERLGLSGKTVANYQSLVRHKLGVQNDVQLARLAEQMGSAVRAS